MAKKGARIAVETIYCIPADRNLGPVRIVNEQRRLAIACGGGNGHELDVRMITQEIQEPGTAQEFLRPGRQLNFGKNRTKFHREWPAHVASWGIDEAAMA